MSRRAASDAAWREPTEVAGFWGEPPVDRQPLRVRATGDWWDLLHELRMTLLVTREYEHLVLALHARDGRPRLSSFPLPHPSGMAVDRRSGHVWIASTRNPNQLFELRPTSAKRGRSDERMLMPTRTWFFPGRMYLHDLAFIGDALHGNAVGHNTVVRFDGSERAEPVWWPRAVDGPGGRPRSEQNYLQLNSIAGGRDLASSFFSASGERISGRRPGQRNYPVDRRGVIFSGASREPICHGLTRPHSARLNRGRLWVDNSGYGEVGWVEDGRFRPLTRLPGWTRGLCFKGGIAFVGTSRVLPRFRQYAPGLDVDRSTCGIHAVELRSGRLLGSLHMPHGDQIFALEWLPLRLASSLPRSGARAAPRGRRSPFYDYSISQE